jgi:hypothetical protein
MAGILLLLVSLVLYAAALGMIASMHTSDAAGNASTQGFAFLTTSALWIFLCALLIVAGVNSQLPRWAVVVEFILVPSCAASALASVNLLMDTFYKSKWPVIVPALAPLLLMAFAIWALFPALRRSVPTVPANVFVWGSILLLSLLPWPAVVYRKSHLADDLERAAKEHEANEPKRIEEERQRNLAGFRQLTPDSLLQDWLSFRSPSNELREQAFECIRKLPRRQADAELMMQQGLDYFWEDVPEMNLEVSSIVCASAHKFLRERAKELQPLYPADPPRFANMVGRIGPYLPTIKWLFEHQCDCTAEVDAIKSTVAIYADCPERTKVLEFLQGLHQ